MKTATPASKTVAKPLPSVRAVLASLDAVVREEAAGARKKAPAKKKAVAKAKVPAKKATAKTGAKLSPTEKAIAAGKPLPEKKAAKKAAGKDLEAMTLAELRAAAKEAGLKGYSAAKKADLLAGLKNIGKKAPAKKATTKKRLGSGLAETTKATKESKGGKRYVKKAGGEIGEDDGHGNIGRPGILAPSASPDKAGPAVPADTGDATKIAFLLHHLDADEAVTAMQAKTTITLPPLGKGMTLSDWVVKVLGLEGITAADLLKAAHSVAKEKAAPTDVHNRLKALKKPGLAALAKRHKVKVTASATAAGIINGLMEAVRKGSVEFRKAVYADIMAGPGGDLKPIDISPAAREKFKEVRVVYTSKPPKKGLNWSVRDGRGKVLAGPFKTQKEAVDAETNLKAAKPAATAKTAPTPLPVAPTAQVKPAPAVLTKAPAAEPADGAIIELRDEASRVGSRLGEAIDRLPEGNQFRKALEDRLAQVEKWAQDLNNGPPDEPRLKAIRDGVAEFDRLAGQIIDRSHEKALSDAKRFVQPFKAPQSEEAWETFVTQMAPRFDKQVRAMEKGELFETTAAQLVQRLKLLRDAAIEAMAKGVIEKDPSKGRPVSGWADATYQNAVTIFKRCAERGVGKSGGFKAQK